MDWQNTVISNSIDDRRQSDGGDRRSFFGELKAWAYEYFEPAPNPAQGIEGGENPPGPNRAPDLTGLVPVPGHIYSGEPDPTCTPPTPEPTAKPPEAEITKKPYEHKPLPKLHNTHSRSKGPKKTHHM